MAIDIVIPEMGESVTQGVIAAWRKQDGEYVNRDEPVLELETDKVTMEVPAPASGVLKQAAKAGETVAVKAVVGKIDEKAAAPAGGTGSPKSGSPASSNGAAKAMPEAPAAQSDDDVRATPLARKLAEERGIDLHAVTGSGAGGRIREQDVLAAAANARSSSTTATAAAPTRPEARATPGAPAAAKSSSEGVRRERMSQLRQRVAARLVEAQHTAAMLTTFNECDMSAVMALRAQYKEGFEKKHGVGLGFMSFFVKAAVHALKSFPAVNASIVQSASGEMEVEYHDYCDIAIAVGTPKGLVVPVLRGCDRLSFAEIESGVKDLGTRARDGKLSLKELQGGTFTITNGGVYGSLMSTPILNPPQTGILGMHAIKNRAIEHPGGSGQAAIRPMMYLALSYDHRLVDGAEAVQFLVAVKQAIEDPQRLLLGL